MTAETHSQLANFIWSICNLLRGPYKRNEYRKVILPLTVLRRFDCLLAPTKDQVLEEFKAIKTKPETVVRSLLQKTTGRSFYNLSKLDLKKLLDDPNQLAPNLNSYINGFSKNIRDIMEKFAFDQQITKMAEKNLLYEVVKKFAVLDLSPDKVDNVQMGYVFEELIRIGAEQSNEEAGEHFTPREVIKLMVNLLLSPEKDLARSHVVKTIYDPACGTGGMLSVSEQYIRKLNAEASPMVYGQDWNDEAWAVCKSDMLIKGEDADNIAQGDTFTKDGFARDRGGKKWTFDYMLANPPFGVEWKQQQKYIEQERDTLGYEGRFGAGLPRINDGALLFLQHMLDKRRAPKDGGSRIGIVFNGSPLFTGDAGQGESELRQKEIEAGQKRQETIRELLKAFGAKTEQKLYKDRKAFLTALKAVDRERGVHLDVSEIKAVLNALGERDESAEICRDRSGDPEPDAELRDTENVPLKESIEAYFKREVLPHVPDAWIDESKSKVGYEIPLNRHFYRYEPPRPLKAIQGDIRKLETEIVEMLGEVAK